MNSFNSMLQLFQETLCDIYEKSEIDAIFYRLMFDLFGLEKSKIITGKLNPVSDLLYNKAIKCLVRLKNYEPIQYITHKTYFYGLDLSIRSKVLIPRPETEELVDRCINDITNKSRVLDVGTGSGCIALAIAKNRPQADITGIDISKTAIEVAERNAKQLGLSVTFLMHDIFNLPENFYQNRFDVIISNPPYVKNFEKLSMHKNVIDFEPLEALFVNDDNPLIYYREIVKVATLILSKNGTVWVEINENSGHDTVDIFKEYFNFVELYKDFKNKNRFVKSSKLIV